MFWPVILDISCRHRVGTVKRNRGGQGRLTRIESQEMSGFWRLRAGMVPLIFGLFDPEHYATAYPDVAERNVDPLVHYLEEGAREGRDPHPDFDTAFYLEQCRARGEEPANPLLHYLLIGAARGFQIKRDGKSPEVTEAPGIAAKPKILVAVESLGVAGTA